MSYESKTTDLGNRMITRTTSGPVKGGGFSEGYTDEATTRTDINSEAANDTQSFEDVAEDVDGVIGIVTHAAPQSGNVYMWAITAGNGDGDFAISNQGELSRVDGHTLDGGPYSLTLRHTEGSPLFRFRDVTVTVTVTVAE